MALSALRAKGGRFPDRRTMKTTRAKLRETFAKLQARGVAWARCSATRSSNAFTTSACAEFFTASVDGFLTHAPAIRSRPMAPTPPPIRVNRAPVLTLWATVVAERLGHPPETALTLGRFVAGSSARAKARRLGIIEERQEAAERRRGQQSRSPGGRRSTCLAGTFRCWSAREP